MAIPESKEELQFILASWMEWCEGLSAEEMMAAAKAHVKGLDGKWPLTPATLWAAHRELHNLNGKPSARQVVDEIMENSARLEKEQGELMARRKREAGL